MKLGFAQIRDSVASTVSGYVYRLIGGSTEPRDARLFGVPGIFTRPQDQDSDLGVEDCVSIESGTERIIIATKNARLMERLVSYLARDLDKGEIVLGSEDGTARCYVSCRPDGTVVVNGDDGGGNTCVVTWDPAAGNVDMETSGNVRFGGALADSYLARYTELSALYGSLKTSHDTHTHLYNPGPGGAVATATPLPLAPAWDPNIASSTPMSD